MSASMIALNLLVAALLILVAFLVLGMCRAAAAADRAVERQGRPDSYEGPDPLRLLEELDEHMQAYGNTVADFYDTTPGGSQ